MLMTYLITYSVDITIPGQRNYGSFLIRIIARREIFLFCRLGFLEKIVIKRLTIFIYIRVTIFICSRHIIILHITDRRFQPSDLVVI